VSVKKNGTVTSEYEYDQNGNRTKYISNNDTTIGTYDDQDRMLNYGNTLYVYGKRGNLQKKIEGTDTTKYDYDNLGNLRSVKLPNGDVIDYIINANNQRIAKLKNGVVEKKWLYSGGLLPVAELDSADNVKIFYGPDYIAKNDTTYEVITDHRGSVRLIVNIATGEEVQRIDYDDFGNITNVLSQNEFKDFTFASGYMILIRSLSIWVQEIMIRK
jgi:YD repeat-containing protein